MTLSCCNWMGCDCKAGGRSGNRGQRKKDSCDANPEMEFICRDGHPVANRGPLFTNNVSLRSRAKSLVARQALLVSPLEVTTSWTAVTQQESPGSTHKHAWEMRELARLNAGGSERTGKQRQGRRAAAALTWPACHCPHSLELLESRSDVPAQVVSTCRG